MSRADSPSEAVEAPPEPARSRWIHAGPVLLVAALLFALALPLFDPSIQLYDRDTGRCEYPFKHEMARRFAQGEFPLWVSWTEAGTSLLGQMTPALFHPATLLFLALPFELAFKLDHLLPLLLAALGAALLARKLGAEKWGAAAAGAGYAGSGWLVSTAASNVHFAYGAAAVPLALHGLLWLCEKPSALRLLWSSFALATALLAGEPQSAIFAVLIGAALSFSRCERTRGGFFRVGIWLALWSICAGFLAAPAALPVLLRLRESNRTAESGATSMFALPPLRALGLVLPWGFDETLEQLSPEQGRTPYSEYIGKETSTPFSTSISLGAPLLLCAFAAGRRREKLLLAAAIFCIAVATGPLLHLDRLLQILLPPLRLFRYAEKWVAPATLLLSLAGGLGLSSALAMGSEADPRDGTDSYNLERKRANAARLGWLSFAFALALFLAWLSLRIFDGSLQAALVAHGRTHAPIAAGHFADSLRSSLLAESGLSLAIACAAILLLRGSARMAKWAAPLAAISVALAALIASGGLLFTAPLELLHGPFPLAEQLRARGEKIAPGVEPRTDSDPEHPLSLGDADWRIGMQAWLAGALATQLNGLSGIGSVAVYSSLGDSDYLEAWHTSPAAMSSLFAVGFQLRSPWALKIDEATRAGFTPTASGMWLRENRDNETAPRAFLIGCARALDRGDAFASMALPGFDPRLLAALRREDSGALRGLDCQSSASPGSVHFSRPSPERFELELDAARPALLVVSEHFDPGWSASIDGAQAEPALQIDRAAIGVPVSAGHHSVSFHFWPRGLTAGIVLALGCALLLFLLGAAATLPARAARARLPHRARSAP